MEQAQSCAGFITILANAYCYFGRSGRVITHGTQVCNCCCHCAYFINAVFQFAYAVVQFSNALFKVINTVTYIRQTYFIFSTAVNYNIAIANNRAIFAANSHTIIFNGYTIRATYGYAVFANSSTFRTTYGYTTTGNACTFRTAYSYAVIYSYITAIDNSLIIISITNCYLVIKLCVTVYSLTIVNNLTTVYGLSIIHFLTAIYNMVAIRVSYTAVTRAAFAAGCAVTIHNSITIHGNAIIAYG